MKELLCRDEVFQIIGCAIEVHGNLGSGFLEAVYPEALEFELLSKGIPFESEKCIPVFYKGRRMRKEYTADRLSYSKIIIELKAMDCLSGREIAQIINYLKVSGFRVGLLLNFGSYRRLEWKRLIG
jgi:GxxExxY protein